MEKVIQEKIPSGGFFFLQRFFFLTGQWADRHTPALSGGVVVPPFGGDTARARGEEGRETGIFSFLLQKREESPGPQSAGRPEGRRENLSLGDGKIVEVVEVREKVVGLGGGGGRGGKYMGGPKRKKDQVWNQKFIYLFIFKIQL